MQNNSRTSAVWHLELKMEPVAFRGFTHEETATKAVSGFCRQNVLAKQSWRRDKYINQETNHVLSTHLLYSILEIAI